MSRIFSRYRIFYWLIKKELKFNKTELSSFVGNESVHIPTEYAPINVFYLPANGLKLVDFLRVYSTIV